MTSKTVTITVVVQGNTAGGCGISLIPLRLGTVIPVNCRKIDAELLYQNALYNTDWSTHSPIITEYYKISTPPLPLARVYNM